MEELIEKISNGIVTIVLPATNEGFSFQLRGFLLRRYGHPSGHKIVFEGGMSEFWFKDTSVHSVNINDKKIVLTIQKGESVG